eukprot:TRINITY_DN1844_c0_g7_i2.p2 TRINITY_DN1844_c0_g7~~TRINITY_DN1844_c0_g7_i2.p2  ORF type:complete len:301 (-),score=58.89 TRINITY_DN1844_c0_g7_i2:129-1031(-)
MWFLTSFSFRWRFTSWTQMIPVSSLLLTVEYTMYLRQKQKKLEQTSRSALWTDFIMENILFYTDIFAEILKSYACKRVYNSFDIDFFCVINYLYTVDNNNCIIEGTIPLSLLGQISVGQGGVTAYGGQIMKALNKVKDMPGKVLDPFHNNEIRQAVKNILIKLGDTRGNFVKEIEESFGMLFGIGPMELRENAARKSTERTNRAHSGVVPKKRHLKQKDPWYAWDHPLAPHENWILLCLCYYIALFVQRYIMRRKAEYNRALGVHEPLGMTWLRMFASKKTAVLLLLGVIILYFAIKMIF